MSKLAVMPMEDYKAICDSVRHRTDKVIVDNKEIYPLKDAFTEILTFGILTEGESYRVTYTDSSSLINNEVGIYKVQNIKVNGKDALGFQVVFSAGIMYVYQESENIMFYVPFSLAYSKNQAVYITLERITGTILSGSLSEKIKETVYEAGKMSKYNEFWKLYQNFGNRTNYLRAFYQFGWNDTTYNPKYPIIAHNIDSDYASEMFAWADITDTKVPVKIKGSTSASGVFLGCQDLVTIRNLDIGEYEGTFKNWFGYCNKLKNLKVTGNINNDFDVSSCKELTPISCNSILTNLKDLRQSGTLLAQIQQLDGNFIEIAKGTLEEGKEYTWSYYDNVIDGWIVDDPSSYPSKEKTWITSTAQKINVNGKEYVGFKATYKNYVNETTTPLRIDVCQDGDKIVVHPCKPISGEADTIEITEVTCVAQPHTVIMPETVRDNGNLADEDIAEAEAKGWKIKWA